MDTYQIVCNGILLAMDAQEVREQFARLFRIAPEKAAAILAKPKTVLRSNLDAASAETYRAKLTAIGLDVDVVRLAATSTPLAHAGSQAAAAAIAAPVAVVEAQASSLALEPMAPHVQQDNAPVGRAAYMGNRVLPFAFHGTGFEYFRIWIVNVFLSIVTLGIYSAWAKVRTRQYFYGNTTLDDAAFQYLATPMQVLRGRIVAVVIFGLYFGLRHYSSTAALVAIVLLIVAAPAIVVVAVSARMRFSAWRNVRFGFARQFREAYSVMRLPALFFIAMYFLMYQAGFLEPGAKPDSFNKAMLMPFMGVLALSFLVYPYLDFLFNSLVVNNTQYGNQFFVFPARLGSYYKVYGLSFVVFAISMGVAIAAMVYGIKGLAGLGVHIDVSSKKNGTPVVPMMLGIGAMVVGFIFPVAYFVAARFNLRYNGMMLGKSWIACEVRALPLLWLYITNLFAIVFSAGLLIPWINVRMVRYRLSCLALHASYELEDVVNEAGDGSAAGQEISDVFDMDIAL